MWAPLMPLRKLTSLDRCANGQGRRTPDPRSNRGKSGSRTKRDFDRNTTGFALQERRFDPQMRGARIPYGATPASSWKAQAIIEKLANASVVLTMMMRATRPLSAP
jgi:hypothetical protein